MAEVPDLLQTLQTRFPQHVLAVHQYRAQPTLILQRDGLLTLARALREEEGLRFDVLMDLSAVDYLKFGKSLASAPTLATPGPLPYYMQPKPQTESWARGVSNDEYRFDVVYHFYATAFSRRLRVRVPVAAEDPVVPSLTSLWASADWFEREVWDMFGIRFAGHPRLRRILMYEEFKGHALRKDYPVRKRQPLIGPIN